MCPQLPETHGIRHPGPKKAETAKFKHGRRIPWSKQGSPGSPPGSEAEFMETWSSSCLPNFIRRAPQKAQCPKTERFRKLERAEKHDGRHGDCIRFPFCWNPQEWERKGQREKGRSFILFSPITAKLGNPGLLERSLCEKGLCRNHLSRLTQPYQRLPLLTSTITRTPFPHKSAAWVPRVLLPGAAPSLFLPEGVQIVQPQVSPLINPPASYPLLSLGSEDGSHSTGKH